MVSVVTELDGLSFLMFRVEQLDERQWEWRHRLVGSDFPAKYREWVVGGPTGLRSAVVQPAAALSEVEVEWRWAGEEDWSQAALRVFLPQVVEFELTSEAGYLSADVEDVLVAQTEKGIAAFAVAGLEVPPGGTVRVTGRGVSDVWANCLEEVGEFQLMDSRVRGRNVTAGG